MLCCEARCPYGQTKGAFLIKALGGFRKTFLRGEHVLNKLGLQM